MFYTHTQTHAHKYICTCTQNDLILLLIESLEVFNEPSQPLGRVYEENQFPGASLTPIHIKYKVHKA